MPLEFAAMNARRILWQDYGIVVPGFDGEDALDALIWHNVETQRQEEQQRKLNNQIRRSGY